MKISSSIVAVSMLLFTHESFAANSEKPIALIIGKWRDRDESSDAVIQFSKRGKGNITETTSTGSNRVPISWKITHTYGNACIIEIRYLLREAIENTVAEQKIQPLTWLIAFDGTDTFVSQPLKNKIVFMDRQK